ncbi:MAG: NUDIX domain-containing protein [Bacilli bacterium]
MVNRTIRPPAICLFQNRGAILVAEGYDGVKGAHFYRPIGGGIEFGEASSATLVREVKEELGGDMA